MKKILSLILSLTLLLPACPALADEALYAPIPDWAAQHYDLLRQSDIYPLSSGSITRGEFLDLLVSALAAAVPVDQLDAITPKRADYFADNYANSYWADVMCRAAAYGIAEGWVDLDDGKRYGNFGAVLTRQEAAKMLCTTLDFFTSLGYAVSADDAPAVYTDAEAIPDWAAPFTQRIASYAIMRGDEFLNFNPTAQLDWPSTAVMVSRMLTLMKTAVASARPGVPLQSELDWAGALRVPDPSAANALTGYSKGYYAIDNGDGTLSALVVPPSATVYENGAFVTTEPTEFFVERYDEEGKAVSTRALPMELPIFGGFLAGADGNFYLAFGAENPDEKDGQETWRIVKYDGDWNRVSAASVTGGESNTVLPFRSTVARLALSADGGELTLHAARQEYSSKEDGKRHQSGVTITVDTKDMTLRSVTGPLPGVHSFGQFVQYDRDKVFTVDHTDGGPRAFLLQSGDRDVTLLELAGPAGQNVTHAVGSGFELSDDGCLFLGCSAPQKDFDREMDAAWNVFLTYTDNTLNKTTLTWLTAGDGQSVTAARLVKLSENAFLAMWSADGNVHYQLLSGKGAKRGDEGVLRAAAMPTTQPVVSQDGTVRWIGVTPPQTYAQRAQAYIYTLQVEF